MIDIYDIDNFVTGKKWEANQHRIVALWNAADGMTTEEAVRYLEHGPEMVEIIRRLHDKQTGAVDHNIMLDAIKILTTMEDK
jgi:hypothetical protein